LLSKQQKYKEMSIITNENQTIIVLNELLLSTQNSSKFSSYQMDSSRSTFLRSSHQLRKPLSTLQIIEICSLCLILIEHTIIFILTFRKKLPKITLFDTK